MPKDINYKPVMRRQETIMKLEINHGVMVPLYNRPDGFKLFDQWMQEVGEGAVISGDVMYGIVYPSKPSAPLIGKSFDECDES